MHCGASCHACRTAAGLKGGSTTIVSVTVLFAALKTSGVPCLSGIVPSGCQCTPAAFEEYSTAKPGVSQHREHSFVPLAVTVDRPSALSIESVTSYLRPLRTARRHIEHSYPTYTPALAECG